jgi:hypothetical protein
MGQCSGMSPEGFWLADLSSTDQLGRTKGHGRHREGRSQDYSLVVISVEMDSPERETLPQRLREFFAFVIVGRYFWVRSVEGGCGEAFATLDEAIEDAREGATLDPIDGPIEVIEVKRRDRMRRVWCSDPTLMNAPIKTGREPGVDFFPAEWAGDGELAERQPRPR